MPAMTPATPRQHSLWHTRVSRLLLAGALLGGVLSGMGSAHALPRFDEVKTRHPGSETLVQDPSGHTLQRLRTQHQQRQGQWVPLDQVSHAFRLALLFSEDKRFYEHAGIDWHAVASAAWGNVWNTRTRGASTLTMQLAGLLDADLKARPGGRDWSQKASQAVWARWLETRWSKDQILEAYINLVPFRGELVGIDALSRTLFGKAAHGLDAQESAMAAALIRAPNASPQAVGQRACAVLRTMADNGPYPQPDCATLQLLAQVHLAQRRWSSSDGVAPHAARVALEQWRRQPTPNPATTAPATLCTTLRAPLQRHATELLHNQLRELRHQRAEDGAVVVLDNASGQVLAWVGSSGGLSQAPEVDHVLALRQAGSTLKPFLYAQAIGQHRLTAASLIEDAPTHIPTPAGLYIPQNYDRRFQGWVSVRTALGASLNVPAVRALAMVSPDAFAQTLVQLGLPLHHSGDYYGLGLALGSPEVSLLSLSNAYRALANQGRYSPVAPLVCGAGTPAAAQPVLSPAASHVVADILSDNNARVRTFGPDSVLRTRMWTAVKTGTSKDMRDNWAVGWSQRYTVGVWIGNAHGAPMGQVSGTTGAAPVWADLMAWLHQNEHSRPPGAPQPPGSGSPWVRQTVRFDPPVEPARMEWFLPGTEQAVMQQTTPGHSLPRIVQPTPGTIVALDPDIPARHQQLQLQAEGRQLRWRIGGRVVGSGPTAQWLPWPGKHTIELINTKGQVIDQVRIEVRGAGVAAKAQRRS